MKRESSRCKSAKWLIATLLVSGAALCAVGEEANAVSGLPEVGFAFRMSAATTNGEEKLVTSKEMKSFSVEGRNGKTLVVWRGHPACGDAFTVTAELVPMPEESGWAYALSYEGNESGLGIATIDFPVLTVPRTDKTAILIPDGCGQIRRPRWARIKTGEQITFSYPWAFRFVASMDEAEDSWYVDQRGDARLYPAWTMVCNGSRPRTVELAFRCALQLTEGNRVSGRMPFGGIVRRFKGDWFAASAIYRRWALEQAWAKAAFSREQGRMRDIAIWFWNRGLAEEVAPPVERFAELTGLPVALDWYWWHKIPYDVGYPFFWPPRDGEKTFSATVRRLVAKGIFVQPYTNGISWDQLDPTWEAEGRPEAIMEMDGTWRGAQFNKYMPSKLSVMCGTAPRFHGLMRGLTRRLRDCGLPGVYLDQIGGGCAMRACWNPAHPHPPGGGTTVADGYRSLVTAVKADNPGLLVSTEETTEAYMDVVDSAINLSHNGELFGMPPQPEAESVPVFQAIYHGALPLYGSYAMIDGIPPWDPTWPAGDRWKEERPWETLYPDQFAILFARGVVFGMQPMVHQLRMSHFDDPRYAGDFAFTVDTARFYHENRDFLYDGTMCAPGALECACQPVEMLGRGIYTRPENARVVRHPSLKTIMHSVWRSKDGRVAAVLCNWSRKEQPYKLSAPDISASGIIPARSWKRIELGEGATKGESQANENRN